MAQSFLSRLLPTMATIGAAVLLSLATFNALDTYRAAPKATPTGDAFLPDQASSAAPTGVINLSQITGWHLFGEKNKQTKTQQKKEIIEAPVTPLKLTLQGTFLGDSKTEGSWAIISSSDDKQEIYHAGDKIPGGATLYAVESIRVILERNGRHESLTFPNASKRDELKTSIAGKAQSLTKSRSANPLPNAARLPAIPSAERHAEKRALIEEMARIRSRFAK